MTKRRNTGYLLLLICAALLLAPIGQAAAGDPLADTLATLTDTLRYYDETAVRYMATLDAVALLLDSGEDETGRMIELVAQAIRGLNEMSPPANLMEGREAELDGLGITYLDFTVLLSIASMAHDDNLTYLETILWYLAEYKLDDRDEILIPIVEIDLRILENESRFQYLCVNEFLLCLGKDIAANYRDSELAGLSSYGEALPWQTNEALLDEWLSTTLADIEAALTEYELLVGKAQNDLDVMEALNRIVAKEAALEESRRLLEEAQQQLEETRQRAREKFAPEMDDDLWLLWGKALRFRALGDDEYVRLCLDAFVQKAQAGDDANMTGESGRKVADTATAFWAEERGEGREGGIMVLFFDPPVDHAFLRTADIIIGMNGAYCNGFDDYTANQAEDGPNTLTYLRLENGGFVQYEDSVSGDDGIRFAGVDLME